MSFGGSPFGSRPFGDPEQASVSSNVTINCTVGNATAAGIQATIQSPISISCSVGNATAAGVSATIVIAESINCTPGNAVAAGVQASIDEVAGNTTINCTPGNAVAAGVACTIRAGGGGITGDNRKKRRYVAKIGDRLVVFDSADRALNAIQRDEKEPDAPIPVQSKKSLPKDAEQVQSIPVAEIKQTARVYDNEARLMQMFQRQRYAEMLALYESLKRQEDEDEIELLMLT